MAARAARDLRRPAPRAKPRKGEKPHARGAKEGRTVPHPLFGAIPLVPRTTSDESGHEREWMDYDPDYEPPLPPGAVRGNVRLQEFCRMCHRPKYFYVDEPRRCVQCDRPFVFAAKEQKYWYETLKFHFDSVAVRCASCRKQRRSQSALERQLALARAAVGAAPTSPGALLSLAEAIARLHELTGTGRLSDGIAAARAARRRAKANQHPTEAAESLFWEATCQRLAGHEGRARELYEAFLAGAPGARNRAYLPEARRWLDASLPSDHLARG